MNNLAPPYRLIRDRLLSSHVVPFLGSGASVGHSCGVWRNCVEAAKLQCQADKCYIHPHCSGFVPPPSQCLPKSSELACYLARLTNFPSDESLELTKVAQYCDVVAGRSVLQQELREIFDQDYAPSPVHETLARVPVPLLIVTTNYDDLIERAFDAEGRQYDLVVHTTDPQKGNNILWFPHGQQPIEILPNKLNIDLTNTTVIYKMHGAVDRATSARDQYVITEDDYINFLTRMTKNKVIPAIFAECFQTRSFLFLGYGLHDWNLRVVLNRIEKELRRPVMQLVSWAVQYGPSALEKRFWQNRHVEVFDMNIDEFVKNLFED